MNLRLAFATAGVDGLVVLEVPEAGPVRYCCELRGDAVGGGIVVVRDDGVPPSRSGRLEHRAEGLWTEAVCETPDAHWSFGLEAFGLRVESVEDERGERLPVGYDLEWEAPDRVHGELLVGPDVVPVDGTGTLTIE